MRWNVQSRSLAVEGAAITRATDYGQATSQQHHDHARGRSSNAAINGFDPGAERTPGRQSEDGGEVEEA